MIIKSQQVFDKVCLDREKPYKPSDYIDFIIYGIKRELINKLMNKLEDHKVYIVELKEPGILEDLPMTGKAIIEQDLVCEKLVQCKHCMMVYPWCQKFRDELDGHGFCPYGMEIAEIIEKRAACDREDTDCTVCFKESHCKALAKAERELK